MSQIASYKKKSYWSGFSNLFKPKDAEKETSIVDEFEGGVEAPSDETKRTFMKLVGASAAFAGVTGCKFRRPEQHLVPYVKRPENSIPGKSVLYASAADISGSPSGFIVETYEGRPTKIEGNPEYVSNAGATSHYGQAAILNLYDPDRLQHQASRDGVDLAAVKKSISGTGRGVVIVAEASTSPTYIKALGAVKSKYPNATILNYEAVNQDNESLGIASVIRRNAQLSYDMKKANVIVSLDGDFLGVFPDSVRLSKEFSSRRDPDEGNMNRLYMFEPKMSLTGGKADHRFRLKANDMVYVLAGLIVELYKKRASLFGNLLTGLHLNELHKLVRENKVDKKVITEITKDLYKNKGKSLVVSGRTQAPIVHGLTYILNAALGNISKTVTSHKPIDSSAQYGLMQSSMTELKDMLQKNAVKTLIFIGGNPAFTSSVLKDSETVEKIKEVKHSLHLTDAANETSDLCAVSVPKLHFLESWGDVRNAQGQVGITQPVIQPIVDGGYSALGMVSYLFGLSDGTLASDYKMVKDSLSRAESTWKKKLHDGFYQGKKPLDYSGRSVSLRISDLKRELGRITSNKGVELSVYPDHSVYDGRFTNNSWSQELPDPVSKLTWDNAAWVSPKMANSLGIDYKEYTGLGNAMVSINGVETAVIVMPGQADDSISLFMGYGRQTVGRIGEGTGFDVHGLIPENGYIVSDAKIEKISKTYELASTQKNHDLHERAVYREGELDHYKKEPEYIKHMVEHPPLKSIWDERKYDEGYQWGISVDLSKCTGCSACVTACQAENNIPIVGKKQVQNGREMHWIRSDRYFVGENEHDAEMVSQPVLCLQCENAPCEQVCPVAATTHSEDGLNDMAYNRCIGTRYCSNNCPVKVRRFNYFDFHQTNPQSVKKDREHFFDLIREPDKSVQKQFNPNVTVRMRGVMEKCTYCVQRINNGKYTAKNENRDIYDGEIKSACAQVCPSDAIVFGNIRDKESQVSKEKAKHRNYTILDGLYLKPRTSYLASIKNPNPELVKAGHHE